MIVRRLVALLTSVTMLHFAVASGDAACRTLGAGGDHHGVMRDGATASERAMPMNGHAMPADAAAATPAVDAAPKTTADVPPCEVPVQEQCCAALTGCSTTAIASASQSLVSTRPSAARIGEAPHDAPAPVASAPEPPPPRA